MTEFGQRLSLSTEPGQFLRTGIYTTEQHFHRYWTIQPDLPSFVHNAHAATAEHGLNFVAGNLGQINARPRPYRMIGFGLLHSREQSIEFTLDAVDPTQSLSNFIQ
jgi:hypothetical protein